MLLLALLPFPGQTETEFELAPTELNPHFVGKEKKAWEELEVNVPAYPGIEFASGVALYVLGSEYTYILDINALSSDEDGVVRYSIAITSPTGANNILYEGLRCKTAQYKTYAYGSQGKWSEAVFPAWRKVTRGAGLEFRKVLYKNYFCDEMEEPFDRAQIVASLQQSERARR